MTSFFFLLFTQVLVVLVCSLATLAQASLEPAGYRPPGSSPQSRYLPPPSSHRMPDVRYIPSSQGSSNQESRKFTNELSRTLSLPYDNTPMLFSQYLPANKQTSELQNNLEVSSGRLDNFVSRQSARYHPAPEIRHSLTQTVPKSEYVPSREIQQQGSRKSSGYFGANSASSNSYLAPKQYSSGHFSSGFSGRGSGPAESTSGHGFGSAQLSSGHDFRSTGSSSGYEQRRSYSESGDQIKSDSGYSYDSPENNVRKFPKYKVHDKVSTFSL